MIYYYYYYYYIYILYYYILHIRLIIIHTAYTTHTHSRYSFFSSFRCLEGSLIAGQIVTFITYLKVLVWPLQAMGFFLFNISQRLSLYDWIETLLVEKHLISKIQVNWSQTFKWRSEYDIKEFFMRKSSSWEGCHLEKGQTSWIVGPTGSERPPCCVSCLESMTWAGSLPLLNVICIKHYRLEDLRSLIGVLKIACPLLPWPFARMSLFQIQLQIKEVKEVMKALRTCGVYEDIPGPCQTRWRQRERGPLLAG